MACRGCYNGLQVANVAIVGAASVLQAHCQAASRFCRPADFGASVPQVRHRAPSTERQSADDAETGGVLPNRSRCVASKVLAVVLYFYSCTGDESATGKRAATMSAWRFCFFFSSVREERRDACG
jgi:hypothetical protein